MSGEIKYKSIDPSLPPTSDEIDKACSVCPLKPVCKPHFIEAVEPDGTEILKVAGEYAGSTDCKQLTLVI